jgi:hypothetical protein
MGDWLVIGDFGLSIESANQSAITNHQSTTIQQSKIVKSAMQESLIW